jgi:hypothetical protein
MGPGLATFVADRIDEGLARFDADRIVDPVDVERASSFSVIRELG